MKFVFPQNYDFKNKILGFIDYQTAILNVIWYGIVFLILSLTSVAIIIKVCIFVILCFPLFLFTTLGFERENIAYMCVYIIKYMMKPQLYLYDK